MKKKKNWFINWLPLNQNLGSIWSHHYCRPNFHIQISQAREKYMDVYANIPYFYYFDLHIPCINQIKSLTSQDHTRKASKQLVKYGNGIDYLFCSNDESSCI